MTECKFEYGDDVEICVEGKWFYAKYIIYTVYGGRHIVDEFDPLRYTHVLDKNIRPMLPDIKPGWPIMVSQDGVVWNTEFFKKFVGRKVITIPTICTQNLQPQSTWNEYKPIPSVPYNETPPWMEH